jgi:Mrp family chromosome partitioning ATPase/capsular polysaccharide biosynthesis protein
MSEQFVVSAGDMDVARYIRVARRWLWLIIVAAALAAVTAYLISSSLPRTYMSAITLVVGDDTANLRPSVEDVSVSQRLAGVYSGMVTREPVLTATVNTLGLPTTWYELQRRVLVVRAEGSQIFEIRVNDDDAVRTKATVDEIARQLTLQSPTAENSEELERRRVFVRQQLERIQANILDAESQLALKQAALASETSARGVLDLNDEIKALELNLTNWRSSYASMLATNVTRSPNTLTVIQPALVPSQPVGPNTRINVLTGALIGMLAAIGAVFLIEVLRGERLTEPAGVARTLGLPVLGTIGRLPAKARGVRRVVQVHEPQSVVAEDFRHLRTNVQFGWANAEQPITILVTSASPQEGKSVISGNLAVAFARAGKRTILVDIDLAHPSVHDLFDVPNRGGLSGLFWNDDLDPQIGHPQPGVSDPVRLLQRRLDALLIPTVVPGLRLLTAGPGVDGDSLDLLANDDVGLLLRSMRDLTDVLILDAPPVLAAAETAHLAGMGVGVLLVVEANATRSDAAQLAVDELRRAQARMLGVVLNKVSNTSTVYYHSYRRRAAGGKRQAPGVAASDR